MLDSGVTTKTVVLPYVTVCVIVLSMVMLSKCVAASTHLSMPVDMKHEQPLKQYGVGFNHL